MECNIALNLSKEEALKVIDKNILLLQKITEVYDIKKALKEVHSEIKNILASREVLDKLDSKMIYQDNPYSKDRTKENILQAKERVIKYLDEIVLNIKSDFDTNDMLTENSAIIIVKRILNNFYKHIEVMYEEPVHGNAGIRSDILKSIKIVNEYDVQRILYSLIKPVFPSARVEVSNDTGFSTIRYDIFIEKFSIVVEVKCSRESMNVKRLTEEIGSDIFHYKYNNIFFFVYDKEKIIKNTNAFSNTYNTCFGNKKVTTIIVQPVLL